MTLRLLIEIPQIFGEDVAQADVDAEVEELNKLLSHRGYEEVSILAQVVEDGSDSISDWVDKQPVVLEGVDE